MIVIVLLAFWDYSYNIDMNFNYDNNVYAYSPKYIDDFLNQIRPYRFPFETYDDLVTSIDFNLLIRNKFIGKHTTTFSFDLNTDSYLVNNQKNYQKYTFGLRQSFGKYAAKISYQVTPKYLIRYYRNPQGPSTDYLGCEVTYHTISGKISFATIEGVTLSAGYGYRWDNYIEEFNRYDANSHVFSFGIEKKLRKYLNFEFDYAYRSSENDSADFSTSGTELTPDGSFYQHSLSGDLSLQALIVVPTTLELSYTYVFRNYTAIYPEDSLHFGRQDHRHSITFNSHSRIMTGMQIKLSATRRWRNATSETLPDIDDIKDYNKYKVGAGIEFYH